MPFRSRASVHSENFAARIRAVLGLTQEELADYLGLTRGQVAHVEAGRSVFSPDVDFALTVLHGLLPAPLGVVPPATEPGLAVPAALDRPPLEARLDYCRHRAAQLRYQLKKPTQRDQRRTQRRQALESMRAYVLNAPATDPHLAPLDRARFQEWVDDMLAVTPTRPALDPTQRALTELRLRLYEAEAAALEALLDQA